MPHGRMEGEGEGDCGRAPNLTAFILRASAIGEMGRAGCGARKDCRGEVSGGPMRDSFAEPVVRHRTGSEGERVGSREKAHVSNHRVVGGVQPWTHRRGSESHNVYLQ